MEHQSHHFVHSTPTTSDRCICAHTPPHSARRNLNNIFSSSESPTDPSYTIGDNYYYCCAPLLASVSLTLIVVITSVAAVYCYLPDRTPCFVYNLAKHSLTWQKWNSVANQEGRQFLGIFLTNFRTERTLLATLQVNCTLLLITAFPSTEWVNYNGKFLEKRKGTCSLTMPLKGVD